MQMSTTSKSKSFQAEAPLWRQLATIGVGLAGGAIFLWFGVPAGGMSGAMALVALVGSLRPAWIVSLGAPLRYLAMVTSGVAIGATVSMETLRNITTYPVSVTGMIVCVFCMTAASAWVSIKFSKWDRTTAVLAAVPGAMGFVLSAVMTTGANAPRVVTVQMIRVFALICLVPLALSDAGVALAPAVQTASDPLWLFSLECTTALGVGLLFTRWKIAGGMMLGAMAVSGGFHLAEITHARAPLPVMIAGQVLIGTWTGSRFSGFDWGQFLRETPSMLAAITVSATISVLFALTASMLLGSPFGATFLAYSPGGIEAMTILALALGFDPFYVAAHHLARFFMLNVGLPLTLGYWIGKKGEQAR